MRHRSGFEPLDGEEWLELALEPTYLVSTHGRCYSLRARCLMTPSLHNEGRHEGKPGYYIWYLSPSTSVGRIKLMAPCAVAILETFYCERPNANMIPEYVDDDRANLHIDNLSWVPRLGPDDYAEMARKKNALYPTDHEGMARARAARRQERR